MATHATYGHQRVR
jgi:hypothetical protein